MGSCLQQFWLFAISPHKVCFPEGCRLAFQLNTSAYFLCFLLFTCMSCRKLSAHQVFDVLSMHIWRLCLELSGSLV